MDLSAPNDIRRGRLRIALVAEDAAGVQVLRRLEAAGRTPAVVLSDGRSRARGATVADAARRLDIDVRPAEEVRDAALGEWLRGAGIDLLLNVHALHVVHPDVIQAPRLGAYNLHPGPLPAYAGLNVPCWALWRGERRHAVTLHRMSPTVDAGDVAYEKVFPIGPADTGLSVMTACVRHGLELVDRLVGTAAAGRPIPAAPQDLRRRRWHGADPPNGGWIDWNGPALRVVGLVRACDWGPFGSPWGPARTARDGNELAIAAAAATGRAAVAPPGSVALGPTGAVEVAAADEWVVVRRIVDAGRPREARDVLQAGDRLARPALTAAPADLKGAA
jgi:methionyl-tRNA formyltransferase